MKVTLLLSLMMALGVLFRPPVYAASNLPQAQGASESGSKPPSNPSDGSKGVQTRDIHPKDATAQRGTRVRVAVTKPVHQQTAGKSQAGLPVAQNEGSIRPAGSTQTAPALNRSHVPNESIYRALPVRSGSTVRPDPAAAGTVRHRDPNAAVIGGAANSNHTTASIDGARTNLRSSRN